MLVVLKYCYECEHLHPGNQTCEDAAVERERTRVEDEIAVGKMLDAAFLDPMMRRDR